MPEVVIVGCQGLQKVAMTKLLRAGLSLSLPDAKNCTDDVLDGKAVAFNVEDIEAAEALAGALENLGAVVEIRE